MADDRKITVRVAGKRSLTAIHELQQEYDRLRTLMGLVDSAGPIDGTTVHTRATSYTVTCLPDDPYDGDAWDIKVEFRGAHIFDEPHPADQQWAVTRHGHWHLGRDGKWDLRPSSDDDGYDDWLIAHRFDLETALEMAAEAAPHVVANGCTPAGLLAWRAEQ